MPSPRGEGTGMRVSSVRPVSLLGPAFEILRPSSAAGRARSSESALIGRASFFLVSTLGSATATTEGLTKATKRLHIAVHGSRLQSARGRDPAAAARPALSAGRPHAAGADRAPRGVTPSGGQAP